ncbi:MAG TPA: TIGR02281 family clan AA aspartic protease [Beijerinckiaceae bacterium]|jgi:aspartyl protease family protein
MPRPIVWALGILASSALSATTASDRISKAFGLGFSRAGTSTAQPGEGDRVVVSADLAGHFVVHPTLDGKRIRMLVDTGASLVVLSHEDARLVGVAVSPRDYTHRAGTANGVVQAAPVRFAEIRVGDIVVRNVDALVLPPGRLGTSLLGMSFLKRLGGFEVAQGRLILKG